MLRVRVQTKDEDGCVGPAETLLMTRTLDQKERAAYHLSNADRTEKTWKLVCLGSKRHTVKEILQAGKGKVGLGHYKVRSGVGWHHHLTLSLLALWFLMMEGRRVGGKNAGRDGAADSGDLHEFASAIAAELRADHPPGIAAHGRGPHLPLLRDNEEVPATTRA